MNFPKTRREELVESIHGTDVADPFRWLEDSTSTEVKDWTREQNDFLWHNLDQEMFNRVSDELVKTFHSTNYGVPVRRGERYFFTKRLPEQDQTVLYYKQGLDGEEIVLVDPNTQGTTVSLDFWNASRGGRYVAYGLSKGGNEMSTMYILDLETHEDLPYEIPNCRYSIILWLPDETGFYYDRNPREGAVPQDEMHLHTKVYMHKLGDDPNTDKLIFGDGRPKDDMIGLTLSDDARYLAISATNNWTHNDVFIYDSVTRATTPLIHGINSRFSLAFTKDRAFVYTNYKANNFRIVSNSVEDLFKSIDNWTEVLPEQKELLQGMWFTPTKMIVQYLVNVCSKVEVKDHHGRPLEDIPLPPFSTLQGISSNRNHEEFFYSVTSYTFPNSIYRYDPVDTEFKEYDRTDNPINPDDYAVKQEWYASKDGTKVPMFIIRRTDAPLLSPTVLYGYGGFNHSEEPVFMRNWVTGWVAHGGTFAIANIRGGGEFGENWHKAAMYEKKQNCFDDFIAAGEFLIKEGYTSKEMLGIMGGSNGGLLTAACSVQRPDLFRAVVSSVPLTDMVRFHTSSAVAIRWASEYGNPDNAEDFAYIYKYSPYHNVKPGTEYPPSLYLTSENDTRVNPYHARKMTAMLQLVNKENPVLLYTETDAGHGAGKPIAKIIENSAIRITFMAQELGLKL